MAAFLASDDTNDKVRRNFVWFSAVIVGTTWLGMSSPSSLSLSGTEIDPIRIWTAVLFVHLYLFGRFWFSPQRIELSGQYRDELYKIFLDELQKRLIADITSSHKTGRPPNFVEPRIKTIRDSNQTWPDIEQLKGTMGYSDVGFDFSRLSLEMHADPWNGRCGYFTTYRGHGQLNSVAPHTDRLFGYHLTSKRVRVSAHLRKHLRSITWSKSLFDLTAPLILAVIACAITLYQITTRLL